MATMRMVPPAPGQGANPCTVNGRTYTAAAGVLIDVPDFDAFVLEANGWIGANTVGTTAARPTNPKKRDRYNDTTLGYVIVWDGGTWRNLTTGAAI